MVLIPLPYKISEQVSINSVNRHENDKKSNLKINVFHTIRLGLVCLVFYTVISLSCNGDYIDTKRAKRYYENREVRLGCDTRYFR